MSLYTSIFKKLGVLIAGLVAAVLVVELFLQILPVKTGLHRPDIIDKPINHWASHKPYVSSSGWSLSNVVMGQTNDHGWVSSEDFEDKHNPILVIGDSYIQSQMNAYDQTMQAVIERASGKPTVHISYSGFSLADYVKSVEYGSEIYAPSHIFILITSGDFPASLIPSEPGLWYFDSEDALTLKRSDVHQSQNRLRQLVKNSATIRYLWLNLKIQIQISELLGVEDPFANQSEKDYQPVVDKFVQCLLEATDLEPHQLTLVIDSHRKALYEGKRNFPLKERIVQLIEKCKLAGINTLNLSPVFENHYEEFGMKFDHSPYDDHWNALGHEVAGLRAVEFLRELNQNYSLR